MTANFFQFQESLRKPRSAPAGAGEAPLSVSQLTAKISKVINGGLPAVVLVRGEVSNFKTNKASGHLYFTLKDPDACLDCVMFRSEAAQLKFQPVDGIELLAEGRVGVYPARGRYQLYTQSLRPIGQGALELAFQQMRRKLEAEGLFAPERKKPLPPYPIRIALMTSPQAAALQDMLKVLRRFPWLKVSLYPVAVQGDGAGSTIANAIARLNDPRSERPELIVLARGGGSLEDLWCFNEESVARAIAASRIPIVTGIGHEVDVSIADLVADYHAHTPTEAAQVITAQWRGVHELLAGSAARLVRCLRAVVSDGRHRLRQYERHEAFRRPMDRINQLRQMLDDRQRDLILAEERLLRQQSDRLTSHLARLERFLPTVLIRFRDLLSLRRQQLDQRMTLRLRSAGERLVRGATLLSECHPRLKIRLAAQKLDAAESRLRLSITQGLEARRQSIGSLARQLEAVSPQAVLGRGYTITTRKKDGQPVRSSAHLKPGDKLLTRFADGQVESTVEDSRQLSLFE